MLNKIKKVITDEKTTKLMLLLFILSMFLIYEGKNSVLYIIIAIIFSLYFLIRAKFIIDSKLLWHLIFITYAGLSFIWASNITNVFWVYIVLVGNSFIAYAITCFAYKDKKMYDYILHLIILGSIALAARIFMQNGLLAYQTSRTVSGLNGNYLGLYSAISANLSLYFLNTTKKKTNRLVYFLLTLILVAITLLSFSRKSFVFLLLPITITFILKKVDLKSIAKRVFFVIIAVLCVLFVTFKIPAVYNTYGYRFQAVLNGISGNVKQSDASVAARMSYIDWGKKFFVRKPIIGYGLNNFKNTLHAEKTYGNNDTYAHNNYIELAVDLGVIGLILYYSLYLCIIIYSIINIKKINYIQKLMFSILITLMICEYGMVTYYGDFLQILVSLIWLGFINYTINKKTIEDSINDSISKMKKGKVSKMLKNIFYVTIGRLIPDKMYLKIMYKKRMGKKLDLKNPKTYNEKLQWLKLYDRKKVYTKLVDKYEVKKYVAKCIGEKYIIPTLGVWDKFDDIDFDKLPNQFVLKCTHDSGGVLICKDKSKLDIKKARRKFNLILKRNFYYAAREWPYKNVKPRIIAEKYVEDKKYMELRDYKFFCFSGNVEYMFIASNRQGEGDTYFDFFDKNFKHLNIINGHPMNPKCPNKPVNFDKMITLAEKLAKDYPHVRIDFYEVNGKVYFGEVTFYHWSGLVPFEPEEWDLKIGDLITLPKK